jgi:DNA-binding NtrC family response regulator
MSDSSNSPCVVLAVDDEPHVLQLVTTIFTRAGFQVVSAANAEEALSVLANDPNIAVLFTDCDMPGMKGPALANIVSERWPHIRIMLASGKPVNPDELPEGTDYVSKPFRPSSLLPKLKEVADSICMQQSARENGTTEAAVWHSEWRSTRTCSWMSRPQISSPFWRGRRFYPSRHPVKGRYASTPVSSG